MNDVVQEPERRRDGIGLKTDDRRESVPDERIEVGLEMEDNSPSPKSKRQRCHILSMNAPRIHQFLSSADEP